MNIFKRNKLAIILFMIAIVWLLYVVIQDSIKFGISRNDPILLFYHIFSDLDLYFFPLISPLFVIIPTVWQFHRELNSGYITNCLTRMEYKKYIKKLYLKSVKNFWVVPVFVIVAFLICCFLTKGFNVGSELEMYGRYFSPNPEYVKNIAVFMLVFITNIILHSIFYANISLFYCKKNSNLLVNIILSYLTFFVIDIFMEVFVGAYLCARVLDIHYVGDTLNLFVIWQYDKVISLLATVIYAIILVIASLIVLFFIYRDRERTVIAIEK